MTVKNSRRLIVLLVVEAFCFPAAAIVVDDYSVATNVPSGDWDLNWNYVYNYKQSSAVAVGEYWVLTAAHVADDDFDGNLEINGTTYVEQEIIVHAGADDPDNADHADLALVRYDKPLPGFYDLYTGSFTTASEFILVGFGNTGTVVAGTDGTGGPGPPVPPSPDYYTDSGGGSGVKRWGTQTYSGQVARDFTVDSLTTTSEVFGMEFIIGDTAYEAGVGTGDSGGGSFIRDSDGWKLAGINIAREQNSNGFIATWAVSLPDYTAWITQTMDSVTGDDDSDGIPNWWEERYATNVLVNTDQDGDGVDGEDEYVADTDPTDNNSFFRIEGTITLSEQTFTFEGSTARQYQLLYTTNDLAATNLVWITNSVPVWGEGAGTEIVITNTENMVFYRMEVILP